MSLVNRFEYGASSAIACFVAVPAMLLSISDSWSATEFQSGTQAQLIESCEKCHGAGGDSQASSTPRLNGQQAEYILDRLKKFSNPAPGSPHANVEMLSALRTASNADKGSIAQYFAIQPPPNPNPGPRAAEGKRIFENGLPAENIIACNLCHGADGEGHGLAPRLSGQHADYLKTQLLSFNYRQHGKTNASAGRGFSLGSSPAFQGPPMNANTKTISQNTIDALASYLENG
jgi:cytochrome c553